MKRKAIISIAAIGLLSGAAQALADEIHVLNWKGYGTDEAWAVEAFEKATGHTVIHDYFNSEQEMLTKLRTNPGTYDVVMINAAFADQAISEKLVQPIDVGKIANAQGIDESQMKSPMIAKADGQFGIPWVWGVTAVAVSDKAFPTPPTSISILWDEAHKGRIVLRDDAVEAIQFGAIASGQNINDIKDMDAVKAKLTSLIPQLRTFWSSENDWNQMMASGQIDAGTYWSGSADRAKVHFKLPVTLFIPEEGCVGWLDTLAIPAGAKNVAGAEAFINYMIDPTFYVEWNNRVGAPVSANTKALAALPETSFNRAVMGNPENLKRIQFQQPISDESRKAYLAVWQQLKVDAK